MYTFLEDLVLKYRICVVGGEKLENMKECPEYWILEELSSNKKYDYSLATRYPLCNLGIGQEFTIKEFKKEWYELIKNAVKRLKFEGKFDVEVEILPFEDKNFAYKLCIGQQEQKGGITVISPVTMGNNRQFFVRYGLRLPIKIKIKDTRQDQFYLVIISQVFILGYNTINKDIHVCNKYQTDSNDPYIDIGLSRAEYCDLKYQIYVYNKKICRNEPFCENLDLFQPSGEYNFEKEIFCTYKHC
jgi:hypothetical protein